MLISAIMRVRNEEKQLLACLSKLVGFCDEIVIVDGGSIDRTEEIARSFDQVVWLDYIGPTTAVGDGAGGYVWTHEGPQRNQALAVARGEWTFIVDADEQPCPRMQNQLRALLESTMAKSIALWGVHLLTPRFELASNESYGQMYAKDWVSLMPGRLARVGQEFRFPENGVRHVVFDQAMTPNVRIADMALFHSYWRNRRWKQESWLALFDEPVHDEPQGAGPAQWPSGRCSEECQRCYLSDEMEKWAT